MMDEVFARGFDSLFLAGLDRVGGEQLVTVDARAGLLTGSSARSQAVAASASLDPDTALTDEVFARGFDSDDPTYSRGS
jgi:hypothetical protein